MEIGANILEPLTHLGRTAQYVRCHHERLNGTGYPRGLKGDEIPVGGQIVALAEVFVSLTESRSYRSASSGSEALETLREGGQGVWYEARVYRALKQLLTKSKSAARQD